MFIHGGSILFTHCGRMISHSVWRREKASDSAASHWPLGSEMTAPRTTSETFAMTGSERPRVAFIQSEKGMVNPASVISKGSRSEEHTSELQSLMRISYAVFCLKQ